MYLKKFIYVNWGNIPQLEFEFGPVNLFSGGNGSGKTTAADAIQTVMTAAHENLFQFNPGQDETTQRGRGGKRVRTLASYVLGCDDGSYARLDRTDGYLAAVFHPTQGETAQPFTAVIGVRAWLDQSANQAIARQEELVFLILPEEQLTLKHFVRQDKAGKYVTPLDQLPALLTREFGPRHVEKYDTKKGYLRRLYAVLRGRRDSVTEREAMAAARAFSRFMAYKPVQSIDKFVSDEILEKKALDEAIHSISAQLKTIHAMERDASRLVESIEILDQARNQAQAYIEQWIDLNTLDYSLALHDYQSRQQQYLVAKQAQTDLRSRRTENEHAAALAQQRREQARDELVELEAQRKGVASLQEKDQLQARCETQQQQLVSQAAELLQQDNQLDLQLKAGQTIVKELQRADVMAELPMVADLNSLSLCKQVLKEGVKPATDLHDLMNRDFTGDLSALEQGLDQARVAQRLHNQCFEHWHVTDEGRLREQVTRVLHKREQHYEQLKTQRSRKQHEIERLESKQVNYPPYVDRALAMIRQQCPQADPRVLCDHIEVTDERWQAAIEGYLGGARFSILVAPEYEAEAIRIVRNMPGRDNRARIIQGDKAMRDAERSRLDSNSIIHVMEFSHATARHYLCASYGTVQRVSSAEELRQTRRGLTSEGMASGNYSMWRCDLGDSELVFGSGARERALKAKAQELEKLTQDWQQANDAMQQLATLLKAINELKPSRYADIMEQMLASHRELHKLEGLIEQLDLTEHEELEARLEELRVQESELREEENRLNQHEGELQSDLRKIGETCKKLSAQQEETLERVDSCEQNLRDIAGVWTELDCDQRLQQAELEARELNVEIAQNQHAEIHKQLSASERRMGETLNRHNQHCRPADVVLYQAFDNAYDDKLFAAICKLQREIDRVYNGLKNNILVEKHQKLSELKDSFNNAFVTHLCHAIYQAINDGQRQVEQLNKELQHHRFGADRETFRFDSDWIPEFRDYARFFEEVIKIPSLGDEVSLFDADLSGKSAQVRDRLMAMLLAEDEHKALRDLERIADYRNYRKYEIYKEVEGKPPIALSEYGTGSGGQLETPAYIIRSAAITSAFRFTEGNSHLRMVLVDEAFSKMDETRSREVINYLTESLGLQLVFIMPTSKCGPFMDLISNETVFAKCPSEAPRGQLQTRVLVDRKQCNQEQIKALWANHRRTIRHQAELDFMRDVLSETG